MTTEFIPISPCFLPALAIPAHERIHAEGDLRPWNHAAHIPCDRPPCAPEAPELTAGASKRVGGNQCANQCETKPSECVESRSTCAAQQTAANKHFQKTTIAAANHMGLCVATEANTRNNDGYLLGMLKTRLNH